MPNYPDPAHALMVSRAAVASVSHEWTGNHDDGEYPLPNTQAAEEEVLGYVPTAASSLCVEVQFLRENSAHLIFPKLMPTDTSHVRSVRGRERPPQGDHNLASRIGLAEFVFVVRRYPQTAIAGRRHESDRRRRARLDRSGRASE
jgi:hypothetical protein